MLRQRAPWLLALIAAVATAAVAVVWLTRPSTYPYGSDDIVRTGFNYLIEREAGIAVAFTLAAVGVVLAVVALVRPMARAVAVAAAAQALCYAFVLGDGSVVAALGYAVALSLPIAMLVGMVLIGRRWRLVGLTLSALILTLAVAGLVTGNLTTIGDAVGAYYGSFVSDPQGYYPRMAWTIGWLSGAAVWSWAAVASVRAKRSHEGSERLMNPALTAAVQRWGRVAALGAALCPVPYGLCRLMWLTPWPLGGPGIDEFVITQALDVETRLRGFLFAPAAAVGVVLTLGLISRWGEVFPRWFPGAGGRPVPVALAVVPGALVAAVMTLAGPVAIVDLVEHGDPLEFAYGVFFMPFPVWGPLLGFAVYAYWLRRTAENPSPRVSAPQPQVAP